MTTQCDIHQDIQKVLFSQEKLAKRIHELGEQISRDYKGKKLIMVAVLRGSVVFLSDLMRQLTIPGEIDFLSASSYGDRTYSSGELAIGSFLRSDPRGKDVLLVDDILDSGLTLSRLKPMLHGMGANSVKLAALFDKPDRRKADISLDYCGFTIPDEFIVGYGLDYADQYRCLPYVGLLKPEVYAK